MDETAAAVVAERPVVKIITIALALTVLVGAGLYAGLLQLGVKPTDAQPLIGLSSTALGGLIAFLVNSRIAPGADPTVTTVTTTTPATPPATVTTVTEPPADVPGVTVSRTWPVDDHQMGGAG